MRDTLIDALRVDLEEAKYFSESIRSLLGPAADDARMRGVLQPARRALLQRNDENESWQSRCGLLIRLFLLADRVGVEEISQCFSHLTLSGALELGLVELTNSGHCRALLSLNAVDLSELAITTGASSWWVISDLDDSLRDQPARSDHVMGVGGATRALLAQSPLFAGPNVSPIRRALDLGTGCGIIALVMARTEITTIIATDISDRALSFARANARLNGIAGDRVDFRLGNLFDPVRDEQFDLIVSNPPFVITPRGHKKLPVFEYRDAGLQADELAKSVIIQGASYLAPSATLLCLANWEHRWGEDGLERVERWLDEAVQTAGGLGAWVIERDKLDPSRYSEMWLRDGGVRPGSAPYDSLLNVWLDDFAARRVTAIGLGSIRVHKLEDVDRELFLRVEEVTEPMSEAPALALQSSMIAGLRVARLSNDSLLDLRLVRTDTVVETREHTPGSADPRRLLIQVAQPFMRSLEADTVLAAAVGACDGDLTLRQICSAIAVVLELDEDECTRTILASVRELVWWGMLLIADDRI